MVFENEGVCPQEIQPRTLKKALPNLSEVFQAFTAKNEFLSIFVLISRINI